MSGGSTYREQFCACTRRSRSRSSAARSLRSACATPWAASPSEPHTPQAPHRVPPPLCSSAPSAPCPLRASAQASASLSARGGCETSSRCRGKEPCTCQGAHVRHATTSVTSADQLEIGLLYPVG
eukprot:5955062-Prymnesium_polylepis.3